MNPGSYHRAGAGQYSMNQPQQYPANHTPHPHMSRDLYQSIDVYGQAMTHGGSTGSASNAYNTQPGPMYHQTYVQRPARHSRPMFPPPNAVVPHPQADGYPQGSGSMHSGQFTYSPSYMPPRPLNYSIATSLDPTSAQPTVQSSPEQQAAPATVGMNPGSYYRAGAGHYSMNQPQQYPTNYAPHPHMSRDLYQGTDVYGRPMAHGVSTGRMSSAFDTQPRPMYHQAYVRWPAGNGRPMFPPPNAVVPHPQADRYPQGSGSMHSGQLTYSPSQMPPRPLNYLIATSGCPMPTQPTVQSSSGQQAAPATAGSQTTAGPPGAAYSLPASSHVTPVAPVSSVLHNSAVDNSWNSMTQPLQPGSAPSIGASSSDTRASNQSEVPTLLANTAPPSSVAAEGKNSANQTAPTSSTPLTASTPSSVRQRAPVQQVPTQVTPSLGPAPSLAMNQVRSVSDIAGQLTSSVGGTQQQAPPTTASGTGEGFTPEGTQQQPCVPLPGPQLRNDVSDFVQQSHTVVCRASMGWLD